MTKLTISTEGRGFVCDDKSRPGSPPVGRGRTFKEAIGDFIINNQSFELVFTPDMATTLKRYNATQLRKR
jgi:hypothetical protein